MVGVYISSTSSMLQNQSFLFSIIKNQWDGITHIPQIGKRHTNGVSIEIERESLFPRPPRATAVVGLVRKRPAIHHHCIKRSWPRVIISCAEHEYTTDRELATSPAVAADGLATIDPTAANASLL